MAYICSHCGEEYNKTEICSLPDFNNGCFICGHNSALCIFICEKQLNFCPKHMKIYEMEIFEVAHNALRSGFFDDE